MTLLEAIELVPVVEFAPNRFTSRQRPLPSGTWQQSPDEWQQYWSGSLADSGVTGVTPLRPGYWLVPTRELHDPGVLERILTVLIEAWEDKELPHAVRALDGGLALCSGEEVLIWPACCVDLKNLSDWRSAAHYRGADWEMLWIGHPWISVRFDGEHLILSEPHEDGEPVARWMVTPDRLHEAAAAAAAELEAFARRLQPVIARRCGQRSDRKVARRIAGLAD